MIRRFYLRDLLGFDEAELEFAPGLNVFTGPSGAGKSLLMDAMRATLGRGNTEAALCELEFDRPAGLTIEGYELDESVAVKMVRKGRTSYYVDGQKIPKKLLGSLLEGHFRHLSVRDTGGLESDRLLGMLDRYGAARDGDYARELDEYARRYRRYRKERERYEAILERRRERDERIEFLRFEIERIDAVSPQEGEYEELLQVKQRLSRLDRIAEAIERASGIFELESAVDEVFELMGKDGGWFSDAMNQLRAQFEEISDEAEELSETDVEGILDRLEALSSLIRRHGSVAEALAYREEKARELEELERLEEDQSALERFLSDEEEALRGEAAAIGRKRRRFVRELESELAPMLERLRLPGVRFEFETVELGPLGNDRMEIDLQGSSARTLSGGEFNRLRLALLAATQPEGEQGGVIFLDEIDANVSGDESIAIAEMIARLAQGTQVFAISHQPHLSARADRHFLVRKEGEASRVEALDEAGRIAELARIVGGERPAAEAEAFARTLRSER